MKFCIYSQITLKIKTLGNLLAVTLGVAVLAGCSSTRPVKYEGLASTAQLEPNRREKNGHVPFQYSPNVSNWHNYSSFILDPITIYGGTDQQFGKTTEADKIKLAAYMQTQFTKTLKTKFVQTNEPGIPTLRIHVTLTGIKTSTPVLSVLPKVSLIGVPFNLIQTARDKEAFFTGSVSFAVEIYDSASSRLLRAYVSKQYPWAENVAASFGTLGASKSGIRNGARHLLKQLDEASNESEKSQ